MFKNVGRRARRHLPAPLPDSYRGRDGDSCGQRKIDFVNDEDIRIPALIAWTS
jgi:hypothetical protein